MRAPQLNIGTAEAKGRPAHAYRFASTRGTVNAEVSPVPVAAEWTAVVLGTLLAAGAAQIALPARAVWLSVGILGVGLLALAFMGIRWAFRRRVHSAVNSVQEELEFARALLLAENEDQVQHLLVRHLEQTQIIDPSRQLPLAVWNRARRPDPAGLAGPILARMQKLASAEHRAATDSLTGLPNKQVVGDTLARMFAHSSRSAEPMAVLLLDLDHFKGINDQFGHLIGDRVLASVGGALRAVLRGSDFAGRNGGEEFAVLLPNTGLDGALLTAEHIRTAIAAIQLSDVDLAGIDLAPAQLSVTVSVGVAIYPKDAANAEQLVRQADLALYTAKRSGRNRIDTAAALSSTPLKAR